MPVTKDQYMKSLGEPALSEQLKIRDILDDLMVQLNGAFVAGYRVGGLNSYYSSDEQRNRTKLALESLVRSLPERSMRMQVRFEIGEGTEDLIDRYGWERRNSSPVLETLDQQQMDSWRKKEESGHYLHHRLHVYFIWDPAVHHQSPEFRWKKKAHNGSGGMSVKKCIQRSELEHMDLLAEFRSLLSGVETTLRATGMKIERLNNDDLFVEAKRALNPLGNDTRRFRAADSRVFYESARNQMATVNIEDEQDDFVKMGGLLYSLISLKDLPDATFPGVLRELVVLDFPLVITADVILPDQTKSVKQFKSRLRKMTAAQRGFGGGFRLNVDAQVAEKQLVQVLQDLISSSLKACQMSMTVAVRTSRPARDGEEAREAQRILSDRRQRVLHAISRMNGAKGIAETVAQKRILFASLPGMAEANKRELDLLTLHTADLLPVEMPWGGTRNSPLMLFETPYRQLIPFSFFDSGLGDANLLFMGKSGSGKSFGVHMILLMNARAKPLISILERGDSYAPLMQLMGGRVINIDLDGHETLNPWDLPQGMTEPTNEKIAFLKNLVRHMLGESHGSDTSLLDNVLTEAIARVYRRCAIRHSNPIPTTNDLREELANWRDEEKMQRTMDEAKLASIKLRQWTGEKGIYARLFDSHTTMRLDNDWLFFNVEGLSTDPRLETAMSMLIASAMASRATGKTGQSSITVLDECWALLDSPALAPEVVQLFRTARKRNSSVWGISQTVEDFVGTEFQPRQHGPGILKNVSTKIIGQQPGDATPLINHLHLNPVAVGEIRRFGAPRKGQSAEVLLVIGEKAETTQTIRIVPTPLSYWIATTFPRERRYRKWFLETHSQRPLIDCYQELAKRFPHGLADLAQLPEELSGAVNEVSGRTQGEPAAFNPEVVR